MINILIIKKAYYETFLNTPGDDYQKLCHCAPESFREKQSVLTVQKNCFGKNGCGAIKRKTLKHNY